MQLLLDEMLKRTAKWLRIFGIDSAYFKGEDRDLIKKAIEEKRILITRDEKLSLRCRKHNLKCILLNSNKLEDQLRQIVKELNLAIPFPEKTRCPSCNTPLELVPKEKVKELVPAAVLRRHERFWLCKECNKAYWEGSHWKNITRIYKTVVG